jgi:hypothetical protein
VLAGVRGAVTRLRIADPISLRQDVRMAPKYHPTPLSGGARKALAKELGKARAMANILAAQSVEIRAKGATMIQQADKLLCESWNDGMWSDGETDRSVAHHRPGRELPLAGDQVRALQDAERRRPRGDEAPAEHLRARSRQPASLLQMRQGGPASIRDSATIGLAASPP